MKPAAASKQIVSTVTESARGVGRVDREKGIIFGAKLLGLQSGNGYSYAPESLQESAKLYIGRPVNLNHGPKPGSSRVIEGRFGKVISAEARSDGVYGDIQYNRKHPLAEFIAEAAAEMPDVIGFSHEARVRWKTPAKLVAESILQVKSVDLVADPATTSGVFEHRENTVTIKTVRESATGKARKFLDWLCEEEMGMGDMPMEAPAADMDADGQLVAGFKAAVMAVIDDASLDLAGKKSKIGELLKMLDKVQNGGAEKAAEPPAEDAPAEESKKEKPAVIDPTVTTLQEELRTLRRENMLHRVCQAEDYKPSPVLLKHLSRCETEADMRELIQEARKPAETDAAKPAPAKVKSGVQGTVTESIKAPTSQEEFNRLCFGKATAN